MFKKFFASQKGLGSKWVLVLSFLFLIIATILTFGINTAKGSESAITIAEKLREKNAKNSELIKTWEKKGVSCSNVYMTKKTCSDFLQRVEKNPRLLAALKQTLKSGAKIWIKNIMPFLTESNSIDSNGKFINIDPDATNEEIIEFLLGHQEKNETPR
jgi:hypothetical protein